MLLKLFIFIIILFINIKLSSSCMRMFVPGGGDIPVTPAPTVAPTTTTALVCSTCPQATVITGSGVGIDQPITQTLGTNANGCRTVTVTCTSPTAGQTVNFFWYNAGADRGTSSAPTTISRTLVCNPNGQLILTENGASAVVNQVECISAPVTPVCTTCAPQVTVTMGSGIGKDEPITQVPGTDANGCRTTAVTCTATVPGTEVFYFWRQAGADRGSSSAITTITRTLVCNNMGQYVLTEGGVMGVVDQVECVSATVPQVCTTCTPQVTVTMGSGIGKDEPITQVPGTDANGCRTTAVTCTATVPGTEVFYFWRQAGADRGSSSAITTITRTLVCNAMGQYVLTEAGVMGVVDQVECVSPTIPVCTTCAAQVTVIMGSGKGVDEPITQVSGMDANGCDTLAVTCTARTAGTQVSYFWALAGVDRGTASATTTISRTLVCNDMAQYVLTEGGVMGVVDQVECVSPPVCSTCAAQLAVIMGSGIGMDEPITQVPGTDANGCDTLAVTCTAAVPGTEVSYFWKLAGADRGSSSAPTTITRNLVCNDMAQYVLTEPDTGAMGVVDQVECVSPTIPVCTTCAAQVTVIMGSGKGVDEPITQVPGMDANGCDTLGVTCTARTAGTQVSYFWALAGADRGTSMATTTITRTLVCNDMAQYVLTEGGTTGIVDQVECVSPPVCSTCAAQVTVIMGSGKGVDEPITQTPSTNANGCDTLDVTCTARTAGTQVSYFWTLAGADRGTSMATTTITRSLVCNDMAQYVLTEGGTTSTVDQVECVSPKVCSTCAAQIGVAVGSGTGKDEPITQVPGMDANGCDTLAVTCTAQTAGSNLFLFWTQAGADRGTVMGTTTVTRTLVCNDMAQFVLTEGGTMAPVDQVECISPFPACETCNAVSVVTGSGIGTDRPIIQTPGRDANNCVTYTLTCTSPVAGQEIFYFWSFQGGDSGFSDGVTTISRVLTCNTMGVLEFTEPAPGGTGPADQVQCITPT